VKGSWILQVENSLYPVRLLPQVLETSISFRACVGGTGEDEKEGLAGGGGGWGGRAVVGGGGPRGGKNTIYNATKTWDEKKKGDLLATPR